MSIRRLVGRCGWRKIRMIDPGDLPCADLAPSYAMTGQIAGPDGSGDDAQLDRAAVAIYLPTARFTPPATAGGRPVAVPGAVHISVVRPS